MALSGLAITTALAAASCAEPDNQPSTSERSRYLTMTRPASVPGHFLPTPNGWFDPDCIQQVEEHETVLTDGRIARFDGSIRREATRCLSPRFSADGNIIPDATDDAAARDKSGEVPTVNGWFEDVDSTALGALNFARASWTVPGNPPNTGQTIYFFPGLEDLPVTRILQPVLGWNHADGPSGWSMASWNCCVAGTTFHGPHIAAAANTTVSGEMSGTNCNNAGVCTNWSIVSFNAAGQGVALNTTVTTAMTWLFGHVLEAFSIDTCNELPGGTSSTASNFLFRTAPNGTAVATPNWTDRLWSGVSPTCNRSVTHTATTATLRWNVVPPVCSPGQNRSCCPFPTCSCLGEQFCNGSGQWGPCIGAVAPPGQCQ